MAVRVLLADDQAPWGDPARDARVFAEIEREKGAALRAAGKDPRAAWEEDHAWFVGLIHCLEHDFGFEVTRERTFEGAMLRADRRDFDLAVIDLSWSGDGDLPAGARSNIGFRIIDRIRRQDPGMPMIAFSQNFATQRELMLQVIQRGALAMQKTYGSIDYLTLGSAILYLTARPGPAGATATAVEARAAPAATGGRRAARYGTCCATCRGRCWSRRCRWRCWFSWLLRI